MLCLKSTLYDISIIQYAFSNQYISLARYYQVKGSNSLSKLFNNTLWFQAHMVLQLPINWHFPI